MELAYQQRIYWEEYEDQPVIAVALQLALAETQQSIKRVSDAIENAPEGPEGYPAVLEKMQQEMQHLTNYAVSSAAGPQPVGSMASHAFINGVAMIHHIQCTYLNS